MTGNNVDRPFPVPDDVTEPFWKGLGAGVLLVQHCVTCDRALFYPRPVCPRCTGTSLEWRPASGRGTIYSFTVVHRPAPGFTGEPYVVALVDLAEGVRMMTRLLVDDPRSVAIGMPVQARIEGDPPLPYFSLTTSGA